MSAAANLGSVATGMTVGFSAVALPALQSPSHDPAVTDEEASWIGKSNRFGIDSDSCVELCSVQPEDGECGSPNESPVSAANLI